MSHPFRFDAMTRAIGAMSRGQKLISLACVVSLLFASAYAVSRHAWRHDAADEMAPILDQPFAESDLIQIRQHLDEKGVRNELRGGKVYVPANQRLAILSDLFYSDVLSGGQTDGAFEALVRQMSAWDPPSKTDKLFNKFRESTLCNVIGHFQGVRRATVMIDPTDERHIGASVHPTAMVDIQTEPGSGADARRLASAAINAVTGAVANLSREQVKVTIDGLAINSSPDDLAEADRLQRKQAMEQACAQKVKTLLAYIPNVRVTASAGFAAGRRAAPERSATTTPAHSQEPPSVVVNAVPMIAQTPAPETKSKSATELPAQLCVQSASVVVPRSYFVGIYRASKGSSASIDPDDGMLQPVVDAQARRIRALVKNALNLADESSISVEPYDDQLASAPPALTDPISPSAAPPAPPPSAKAGAPLVTLTPVTAGNSIFSLGGYGLEAALVMGSLFGVLLLSALMRRRGALQFAGGSLLSGAPLMEDDDENDPQSPATAAEGKSPPDAGSAPFTEFHAARADHLLAGLREEHPRAIALILSQLPPAKAAAVMEGLDPLRRLEVTKQSVGIELPDRAVIHRIERGLRQRLEAIIGSSIDGTGDRAAAAILDSTVAAMDSLIAEPTEPTRESAIDAPSVGALAVLAEASDEDLCAIIEQLDSETILMALRGCDAGLRRRVLDNMVDDEAARIERKLGAHTSVRLRDIESAQLRVVEAMSRLEAAGEIAPLSGRAGREALWR